MLFKALNSDKSNDPFFFGDQCESGDFSDCFQGEEITEVCPTGCERILIFTQSNRTCGINCDRNVQIESTTVQVESTTEQVKSTTVQNNDGRNQRLLDPRMAIKEGWSFYLRFF